MHRPSAYAGMQRISVYVFDMNGIASARPV